MAAVTQIRHRHSEGRAYYDRKLAEGKTPKEALRSLKRRVSDAIYSRLQADARRAAAAARTRGPGGQPGNDSVASAAGSHPEHRLFGQATPEPDTTLRPPSGRSRTRPAPARRKPGKALDTKRPSLCAPCWPSAPTAGWPHIDRSACWRSSRSRGSMRAFRAAKASLVLYRLSRFGTEGMGSRTESICAVRCPVPTSAR